MTFFRVMLFSLTVLLAYTGLANLLPQMRGGVETDDEVKPDTLDRAGQIAWGERIFNGKGTCNLCHNSLGRAPNLMALNLSQEFAMRTADTRYSGAAKAKQGAAAIESYVIESLRQPSAYVVAGFGKKGSNDTISPMPDVGAAPISLMDTEVDAVVAFLEDRAGIEVTVPLPGAAAAPVSKEETMAEDAPATTAKAAVEKYGCSSCHDLFGSGADLGPKLAGIGIHKDREALRHAILEPNAEIAKGFQKDIMPQDFAKQMRAGELDLVVDYLSNLKTAQAGK